MEQLGQICQDLRPRRRGSFLIIVTGEFIYCNQLWRARALHFFCSVLYKEQPQFKNRTIATNHLRPSVKTRASLLSNTPAENMQKSLAIFLVIALVVAVVSLPTVEGFSGGSGTWKRALQVSVSVRHFSVKTPDGYQVTTRKRGTFSATSFSN